MTPRQLLADALGVPVRRVRKARVLWWAVVARTGPVRWHYEAANDFPGSGWLTASTDRYTIRVEPSPRRPLPVLVAEIRAGLEAMGARVPLILRWTGDTLYARRVGDPFAVGYAVGSYVRVYEPAGNGDTVRQSRNDNADPRAGLLAMLATYYPGVPVVEAVG